MRRVSPIDRWKIDRLWGCENIFNTRDHAIIARSSDLKPCILNFVQETDTPRKYVRTSYNGTWSTFRSDSSRLLFFSLPPSFHNSSSFMRHYASVTRVEANLCDTWHRATGGNEPPGTRLTSISHFAWCISVSDTRWRRVAMSHDGFSAPFIAMGDFEQRYRKRLTERLISVIEAVRYSLCSAGINVSTHWRLCINGLMIYVDYVTSIGK